MNRQYPLKAMADELERHGRFGDTELVHLNPIEVAGLAALSPTGKLTINPVTGKKEAFLPLLIPIIASYGGSALAASAGASMVGAAIAGGAASGLATYAQTGDAERGLYSGIMGAGIGAAAGAAGEAARGIADPALTEGIAATAGTGSVGNIAADEAARLAAQQAAQQSAAAAADPALGAGVMGPAAPSGYGAIGPSTPAGYTPPPPPPPAPLPDPTGMMPPDPTLAPPIKPPANNMFMSGNGPVEGGFKQTVQDPFMAPKGEGMMAQMTKSQNMLPIAIGGGQLAELNAQDDLKRKSGESEAEHKKRLQQAYDDLQGAYGRAQPNLGTGSSPYRSGMSRNTPKPWSPNGMAAGGITRLSSGGASTSRGVTTQGSKRGADEYYGTDLGADNGYGGIDPVSVQAGLRGQYPVAHVPGYMAGMQPEFNYFQNDLENIQVPPMFNQQQLAAPYNTSINRFAAQTPAGQNTPYFTSNIPSDKERNKPQGMAGGGQVPVSMGGEQAMIEGGGIANMSNQYTNQMPVPQSSNAPMPQAQPEAGGEPSEQDITLLASVLMGENPKHADQIIEAFVAQYGPEKFAQIRDQILKMIGGPNAQTEGMIRGQGGGMDDQVMGTIGKDQQVAVSPGEYVVPADVVSGLGDGSSDAGAAELDRMQQDVRMARGGGTNQPPPIDARRYMPA